VKVASHLEKIARLELLRARLDPLADFELWFWAGMTAGTHAVNAALHHAGITDDGDAYPSQPGVYLVGQPDGSLKPCFRRLGDVLLATPLIRSIRRAWPDAALDALVFAETAGILDGNPDLGRVIAMPARPSFGQGVALAARLFRRYDLAVSTQSGDRPTVFALLAGHEHVGPVWPGDRLKRRLLRRCVAAEPGMHRVEEMLRIADALGIPRVAEVVCPAGSAVPPPAAAGPDRSRQLPAAAKARRHAAHHPSPDFLFIPFLPRAGKEKERPLS